MALLFSAVTVTAGEDEIELLVGGIPREYDDLEGWSEFDDLMYFISEETEVSVRAEAYLYGEGESMRASPEEIDDLMQRVPFPVSWTVKMKKKQKETQDILSYHSQAAGCSDKARAKASGGRQPIEECGRTGL